ncbi:tRNA N6-adenosine threonylcarbamoyltransferase [endosymbiont of Euscepes postfasciatus]|uniref:tRNA (adenosine(37)-N6)-threonylcarbamoyltransferase complex transferase subunit TsaD n=1 Tax=endosymbiont of Euscepes postfasciatus TaxID=650377 RepID=UPI000DC6DBC7|nr:tRNA (adenosine(37)-N6)-threonylcarbamoyltransferase complex transferase subunit TsaD [endosymbiont of Euscepes postfasciatus]BBA84616.1 tRNA N6-adenosine threonylcarbamoyltransferase [endosymbiont of Euscepes postfasciatus]
MKILGIETSCDNIGISIFDSIKNTFVFNKIFNQLIHKKYGGVVPNLASIHHSNNIYEYFKKTIKKYNININNDIDCIACTAGPGLFGSLVIGSCFSKSLSYSIKKPFYEINHLEGHLLSSLIYKKYNINKIFPFISLIISGGNTKLIFSEKIGNYKIIGETLDDSIGEIIDKIAKKLKLNYPGGPEIYKLSKFGTENIYKFPIPIINNNNLNFSFSGLKTYIINIIDKYKKIDNRLKYNISLELQNTLSNILIKKSFNSLKKFNVKTLLISGGVSSNIFIRKKFKTFFKGKNIKIFFPKIRFCTDNGAMIAYACYMNILYNKYYFPNNKLNIFINTKWSIENV